VSDARRFPFAFAPEYARPARAFGITPERAWVAVEDDRLEARFGRWRVRTPLSNILEVEVTGPYRYLKTAGPARLGVTDLGITFATNGERGVRLGFAEKVLGIERLGVLKHPELTVTVADVDGLAALLRERTRPAP
jgi:hypothetical protein